MPAGSFHVNSHRWTVKAAFTTSKPIFLAIPRRMEPRKIASPSWVCALSKGISGSPSSINGSRKAQRTKAAWPYRTSAQRAYRASRPSPWGHPVIGPCMSPYPKWIWRVTRSSASIMQLPCQMTSGAITTSAWRWVPPKGCKPPCPCGWMWISCCRNWWPTRAVCRQACCEVGRPWWSSRWEMKGQSPLGPWSWGCPKRLFCGRLRPNHCPRWMLVSPPRCRCYCSLARIKSWHFITAPLWWPGRRRHWRCPLISARFLRRRGISILTLSMNCSSLRRVRPA